MFSDESTMKCFRSPERMCRPSDVKQFQPNYTVRTLKHPHEVMVWECCSGNGGRGGMYFLQKNENK